MKRIVLLTDPDRLDVELLQQLQWVFPECHVEIVAVAEGTDQVARRHPAADTRQYIVDELTG